MAERDNRKAEDQTVESHPTPGSASPADGGPLPGRAGMGMGESTGDYTDAQTSTGGGPETTVTVGKDTGQKRDK
ncbi:hypothetical protein [Azospirillum soli]|uniref:hypothetical protein n=1 Tax=Azospirillum soli TaxID=1304799 RepID=UPI001AEA5741|nr:hypothetical protein [Azospirillum soli]MBP2311967.1 hypothetical protein [Azospirillum soli]